jgi:hypothetical protein
MSRMPTMKTVRTMVLAHVALLAWTSGCDDTRRDWSSCVQEKCDDGFVCVSQRCVRASDGGSFDGQAAEATPMLDGPPRPFDVAPPDAPAVEVSAEVAGPTSIDAVIDRAADAPVTPALDATLDAPADVAIDLAVDTRVPDAAGTCAGDDDCGGATPYCVDGRCAACKSSAQCQGGAPICSATHACVSCAAVDAGCAGTTPACEADSGRCVECASNDGCPLPTKPICDGATHTCMPCTSDGQCAGVGPGVCMAHLDGRCAADAETVYAGSTEMANCSDLAGAGSATRPYCSAQQAVLAAKARGKALVLLTGALSGGFTGIALSAPLTVVGRDVRLTPADFSDGIGITSGEIYLRGLTIVGGSAAAQTGIAINAQASANATLFVHIDACTIIGNPGGGILLGGAAFEIRNTVVTGNGPGQTAGGTTFGGIRVDSIPAGVTARLERVTLSDNLGPGLSCAGTVAADGVLASGNTTANVTTSCGITPCPTASATCGAQP